MIAFDIVPGSELSGQVFPPDIQSRNWIGFHGTASAYSEKIEREGFVRNSRPISDVDIDFVTSLAALRGADPLEKVAGFKMLNSISFSSSPLVALAYAHPGQSGGQGVKYVHDVARILIDQQVESLSADEQQRLKSIIGAIDLIRQSRPVIYAFDLQGLDLARFQNGTAAIHVYADVSPQRILAKAVVPDGIDHDSIDPRKIRDGIRERYMQRRGHWICEVPQ